MDQVVRRDLKKSVRWVLLRVLTVVWYSRPLTLRVTWSLGSRPMMPVDGEEEEEEA